jgi:NCS1 family nucleobase:cation symporter-1
LYSLGWILGCTFSSVIYFGLAMVGDFCKTERAMRFEESYDTLGMFCEEEVEVLEGLAAERDREKVLE